MGKGKGRCEPGVPFRWWDGSWSLREGGGGDGKVENEMSAEMGLKLKWNMAVGALMMYDRGDRSEGHDRGGHAGQESNSGPTGPRGVVVCP